MTDPNGPHYSINQPGDEEIDVGKDALGKQVHSSILDTYTHHVTPKFYGNEFIDKEQMENPTNKRKSTRYTWYSFFPIAIGLQFLKVVNIFYLITGTLQTIKSIQTNSPFAIFIPLSVIIGLGVTKELIGELKRYKDDKKVNATPVTRLKSASDGSKEPGGSDAEENKFEQITLADIEVGDIIRISDGEQVPADCVLLKVKDNKPECFVSTSPLDGERNLKPKLASINVSKNFDELFDLTASTQSAKLSLDCIKPIKDLYTFDGRLKMQLDG